MPERRLFSGRTVSARWCAGSRAEGWRRPKLARDYLHALGQLLVERRTVESVPTLSTHSTFSNGTDLRFEVVDPAGFGSFLVDIRTESGWLRRLPGVVPDAAGVFSVAESEFSPGEENWVRIRGESDDAEAYSGAAVVSLDPSVTSQSPNQVRILSVARSGNDIHVRWKLLQENGKTVKLYFERADGGGTVLLTPTGIPPGVNTYTLPDQALASPCGTIVATQEDPSGETGPSLGTAVPGPSGTFNQDPPSCDPSPPPPGGTGGYTFADAFHHRDHLGSLRVVTDAGGLKVSAHDYYPYGLEMGADSGDGSRKRFTGHERDAMTGQDYMLARYCGPQLGRFLGVDPAADSVQPQTPQTWNRFAYVRNSPTARLDPDGKTDVFIGGAWDGDDLSPVYEYYKVYKNDYPEREVAFFRHDQAKEAIEFIKSNAGNGQPRNIISHSWGASTAVDVALGSGVTIDNLIAVDPVGKYLSGSRPKALPNVKNIVRVDVEPTSFNLSNVVEAFGRGVGIRECSLYCGKVRTITGKANHENFKQAFTEVQANGMTAKSIIDKSYAAGLKNARKILVNEQRRAAPDPRDRGLQNPKRR